MVVDQDGPTVGVVRAVAGEMKLLDCRAVQRLHVRHRVEAQVSARDEDVVDVAEEATPRPGRDRVEKLGLGDRRAREAEVARGVLEQDLPAEGLLGLVDVCTERPLPPCTAAAADG
jgi:hypothetical protein